MNLLSIAQRLRQESGGISGNGPTTTVSQLGEMKSVVDWCLSAYEDIQNLHTDWAFLCTDLTFSTVANTSTYSAPTVGAPEYGEWIQDSFRSYLTSGGVGGEQYMRWMSWPEFRDTYLIGSTRVTTGQPLYIAQKPDTSLVVWPTPNAVYTINGEYYKRAQTMKVDADIPIIPAKYHMIIVWRALMFYAGQANAPEMYAVGEREYKRLLNQLRASQLPDMMMAGPLA